MIKPMTQESWQINQSNFYLRDKFLSLHAVNVSWHIKGSNDIENIISASKSTTIEITTGRRTE